MKKYSRPVHQPGNVTAQHPRAPLFKGGIHPHADHLTNPGRGGMLYIHNGERKNRLAAAFRQKYRKKKI
jgi:hypothetical protein